MELNFITFTNPAETRRAENRRYIRTQVLRKYHAKRRSAKQKAQNEQSQRALAPRGDEEESSDTYGSTIQLYSALALIQSPSPDTYLAAGLVDSFSAFPIVLSEHDRFFLDRCEFGFSRYSIALTTLQISISQTVSTPLLM